MAEVIKEIEEAILTKRKDGIIQIHFKEGIEINVELQEKMRRIYKKDFQNNKKAFLLTGSDYVSINKEARDNSIIKEARFSRIPTAIVAHSVAYKLQANFYLQANKPKSPCKVFNDKENAIEWLKTLI
jgi:hypothetical protein